MALITAPPEPVAGADVLAAESPELESDGSAFGYYPVVAMGVTVGFWFFLFPAKDGAFGRPIVLCFAKPLCNTENMGYCPRISLTLCGAIIISSVMLQRSNIEMRLGRHPQAKRIMV
jgi:hypothetical protein